jgi:hypothetical protein
MLKLMLDASPVMRKLESDPDATVMLPAEAPLRNNPLITNGPGMSSLAAKFCPAPGAKVMVLLTPETGNAVQFAGLLQVLLAGEIHVCACAGRANDIAAALAATTARQSLLRRMRRIRWRWEFMQSRWLKKNQG